MSGKAFYSADAEMCSSAILTGRALALGANLEALVAVLASVSLSSDDRSKSIFVRKGSGDLQ
jgi:hypothetical protein